MMPPDSAPASTVPACASSPTWSTKTMRSASREPAARCAMRSGHASHSGPHVTSGERRRRWPAHGVPAADRQGGRGQPQRPAQWEATRARRGWGAPGYARVACERRDGGARAARYRVCYASGGACRRVRRCMMPVHVFVLRRTTTELSKEPTLSVGTFLDMS